MGVYNVDLASLKGKLLDHLDNKLGILVIDNGWDPKPTAAFQRVFQRAQHRALELGHSIVTGANILEAILFETESPAVRFLAEQGITRQDILNLIAHGKGWHHVQRFVQQSSKRRPKDSR